MANLPESTREVLLEMTLPMANKKYPFLAFAPDTSDTDIRAVRQFVSDNSKMDISVNISSGKYCSLLDADEEFLRALPYLLKRTFPD